MYVSIRGYQCDSIHFILICFIVGAWLILKHNIRIVDVVVCW